MDQGEAFSTASSQAIAPGEYLVLPLPAPANTRRGPSGAVTALALGFVEIIENPRNVHGRGF